MRNQGNSNNFLEKQDNVIQKERNNSIQNFRRHLSCIEDNHRTLQAYYNKNNVSKNPHNLLNNPRVYENNMHLSSRDHNKGKIPTITDL